MNVERGLAIGVVVAAGAAVLAGLLVLGSPAEERSRMFDARRVEDLQALNWALRRHHQREGRLPERIEEVIPDNGPIGWRDPRTGDSYTYRLHDEATFELCATFERGVEHRGRLPYLSGGRDGELFRFHDAGFQCFTMAASVAKPALGPATVEGARR